MNLLRTLLIITFTGIIFTNCATNQSLYEKPLHDVGVLSEEKRDKWQIEEITHDKLARVGAAEEEMKKLGFRQFRVRSHDNLACIEIDPAEMDLAWKTRGQIDAVCRSAGYTYTALDLRGYRTGAMNEALALQDGNIQSLSQ